MNIHWLDDPLLTQSWGSLSAFEGNGHPGCSEAVSTAPKK
jgi:hypothetical protein